MSLGIPDAIVPGISYLSSLSERARDSVIRVAAQIDLVSSGKNLEQLNTGLLSVSELADESAKDVGRALLSFLSLGERYKSDEELISDLADAVQEHKDINWESDALAKFLGNLFAESTGLRLRLKAQSLEYDRERIMLDAQIFTDVRPVYDLEEEPKEICAYVVNNTLKIEYIDQNSTGPGPRTIYFGVDDTDLSKLKFLIERAESKKKYISADLVAINKPILGESGDD